MPHAYAGNQICDRNGPPGQCIDTSNCLSRIGRATDSAYSRSAFAGTLRASSAFDHAFSMFPVSELT